MKHIIIAMILSAIFIYFAASFIDYDWLWFEKSEAYRGISFVFWLLTTPLVRIIREINIIFEE